MENQQTEEARKKWVAKKRKAQVQNQLMNEALYLQRIKGNDQSTYALCEQLMAAKGVSGLQEVIRVASAMLHHISASKNGEWD